MKKLGIVVGAIVAVLVVALVVLRVAGLDPNERRAGLWLTGEVVTTPVTDWIDQYNLSDGSRTTGYVLGGSPWTGDRQKAYREQSPITYATKIKTPTLVMTNMEDFRVPPTQAFARLHGDGSLDGGFGDPPGGLDSNVQSIALQADGRVLIAGAFTTINQIARNRVRHGAQRGRRRHAADRRIEQPARVEPQR